MSRNGAEMQSAAEAEAEAPVAAGNLCSHRPGPGLSALWSLNQGEAMTRLPDSLSGVALTLSFTLLQKVAVRSIFILCLSLT